MVKLENKIQGVVFLALGILTTLSFLLFCTADFGPLVIYITEFLLFATFFTYLAEPTSLKGLACFLASLFWLVDQWQSGLYLILENIPNFAGADLPQMTVFNILGIPSNFGFTALMFLTVLAFVASIFDLAYELKLPIPGEGLFQGGLVLLTIYGLIKGIVDYQLIGAWDQALFAMIWAFGILAVALSVLFDHIKATEKSKTLDAIIWIGLALCTISALWIHGSGLWLLPL